MELDILNKNLLILGAGGHGRVVKETAVSMESFDKIDFLDDKSTLAIGKLKDFKNFANNYTYAFVAFGNNVQRMKWVEELIESGFRIPVLIDPTAHISPSASIDKGSIVCAKAVIHTKVIIEKGCIISIGALIDHDCVIGRGSHINSGAIVKAGSKVAQLKKLDSGMVYSNEKILENYSFEIGV
jgi:UDP-N-acetylbacillosamine N-acetyltransferase